jgi:subtilisin family serine protease
MFALVSVAEAGGKDASAAVRVPVPASSASVAQLELNQRLAHDTHLAPLAWGGLGPYVADHVLVGFRLGASVGAERGLEARVGVLGVRRVGVAWLLVVRPGRVWGVIDRLRRDRSVRYAEPDYVLEASGVPNDPSFGLQWGLQNTGQSVAGTAGTAGDDEDVVPAWNVTTGSSSIVVAVTDTGVDYNHPDLQANMWSNTLGIGGCAAGTHGFDVLAGESACDPMDTDSVYGGHGTHVAGIIGAVGNNGVGVAGVNWTSSIMAVKWLDSESAGSTSDLLSALQMVVTAKQAGVNVRVVNDSSSFPGTASSQALESEISTLGANNILFVTAAGNSGEDDDTTPRYPCSYDLANEICVAASDQNDQLPSWADYGPSSVDLAAPGNNIYSTLCSTCAGQGGASYGFISGASMSAAEVSGAAALILSAENMSVTQLKADILDNVNPIPALNGLVRTGGILDVCKAIPSCATAPPAKTAAPVISGSAQVGQTLTASNGTWTGPLAYTTYSYQWQRCDASGANCSSITGQTGQSYGVADADVGDTLAVTVTASNSDGSASASSAATVLVPPTPPANTAPPVISGSARVGQTLTASNGTWSGASISYGYAWQRCDASGANCSAITGQTGQTYSVASVDVGHTLAVTVTASNGGGSRSATSAATATVPLSSDATGPPGAPSSTEPTTPRITGRPGILGRIRVHQRLTAAKGSWTGSPTRFRYQWRRCNGHGLRCRAIAGATSRSYTVVGADLGKELEVTVTASNAAGSSSVTSRLTATVRAAATSASSPHKREREHHGARQFAWWRSQRLHASAA